MLTVSSLLTALICMSATQQKSSFLKINGRQCVNFGKITD
jgi:hypothetical protein